MILNCLWTPILTELPTSSTWDSQAGMHIRKELGGVRLNLPDVEAISRVLAISHDARRKGAADASDAVAAAV